MIILLAVNSSNEEKNTMTDNLDNLRSIEGFPKGKDEDLLALSNRPITRLTLIRISKTSFGSMAHLTMRIPMIIIVSLLSRCLWRKEWGNL